ncbi:MAG TPA: hypothetical protein VHL09_07220 [Dehalococcoidia bacterium]|nr:hypothetical protein [Dehalococcoidia bacterium]
MIRKLELTSDLCVRYAKEIEEVLGEAVREALLDHKRARNPIAGWKDGRVVIIPPDEIPVNDDGTWATDNGTESFRRSDGSAA